MSSLFVYSLSSPEAPLKVLNHLEDIAATLAGQGIGFARRTVQGRVAPGELDAAAQAQLQAACAEYGLSVRQVVSQGGPQDPLPAGWTEEHRTRTDELRWFLAGRAMVYLRQGDCVQVLVCEKHDLLQLPAGTAHWVDSGDNPCLVVARLAAAADEQADQATGDDIARRFPRLDY